MAATRRKQGPQLGRRRRVSIVLYGRFESTHLPRPPCATVPLPTYVRRRIRRSKRGRIGLEPWLCSACVWGTTEASTFSRDRLLLDNLRSAGVQRPKKSERFFQTNPFCGAASPLARSFASAALGYSLASIRFCPESSERESPVAGSLFRLGKTARAARLEPERDGHFSGRIEA